MRAKHIDQAGVLGAVVLQRLQFVAARAEGTAGRMPQGGDRGS
jgi:hypothetical protein